MNKQQLSKNQLKKEFIRFLKERDLVTKYCAYLASNNMGCRFGMKLSSFLNGFTPDNWINYAFLWSKSAEGRLAWKSLNEAWEIRLNALK